MRPLPSPRMRRVKINTTASRALARGAYRHDCTLSAYATALLLNESGPSETRSPAKNFTKAELAAVNRWLWWESGIVRELDGAFVPKKAARAVAAKLGVKLNDMIREGLARILAEFKAHGSVRFGITNGRAKS